jgi:2-polyprenyl-6-methoxyphenol hydroxylase-like FAD-dependent oxidoreductase
MEIACIGGGPSGLYFSILMKSFDPRHNVVVYERHPRDHVTGWGVGFWDNLLNSLYASDTETAQRVSSSAIRWQGQNLVLNGEVRKVDGSGGYGINRRTLLEILNDRALEVGVDIRFEHPVTDIRRVADADVVVAADGANSVLRRAAQSRFGTEYLMGTNKYAWLATDKRFDAFTFAFERTHAGWVWFHGYAIDRDTSVCIVECSPETWEGLGLDALPAGDSLRLLEATFSEVLDGRSLLAQGIDTDPIPWLNFRTLTNHRWWSGNTVLLGDAAHTAHFSIGHGTTLALQDAIALARSLSMNQSPQQAFSEYQRARRREVCATQRDALFSSQWLENVDRYGSMPASEFFTLLRARRDPILAHVPPELYYRLYTTVERNDFLRGVKSRFGPRVRRAYGQLVRNAP